MGLDQVRNHFEEEAFENDDLIAKLIPRYYEQHEVILQLIPFERDKDINVLDLGSGTGRDCFRGDSILNRTLREFMASIYKIKWGR